MAKADRSITVGVDLRALVGTPTGIGFYTLALLERLAASPGLHCIGLAHREPQYADRLREAGAEVEVLKSLSGVVWQQTTLAKRLGQGDIDVFWSPILTLPLRLPVPAVTTVHDLTPLLHPELHRFKVVWSIRPFLARNLAAAAAIVADSESTAADIRRYYPDCDDRLQVIYPGTESAFRPGSEQTVTAVRRRLECPRGYLLYSGTLEPRKNLDYLLDAWQAARAAEPETLPLLLTGPAGWVEKAFFSRLDSLADDGVRWLGRLPRSELIEVMQAARWFIYPSLYEGFGLPVAEAMACAVPVITTTSSSLPEIVGDSGFTVDPHDPADLASLLVSLPSKSAQEPELGARARRRSERFDWDLAADQLETLFGRVCGE